MVRKIFSSKFDKSKKVDKRKCFYERLDIFTIAIISVNHSKVKYCVYFVKDIVIKHSYDFLLQHPQCLDTLMACTECRSFNSRSFGLL